MKARGNTKIILKKVEEIQFLIGYANQNIMNDQDINSIEQAQKQLNKAHEICIDIRSMYELE
ncbi:hypothetical protein [Halalkalibacter oceani]|uniref:hypothetical protein n=1 Tax=Halalkalibacter oceani TaxID=1653776 RepID=UPI0033909E3B